MGHLGPFEGGSQRGVRGALGGQVAGGGRPVPSRFGAALVRDRRVQAARHVRELVRHGAQRAQGRGPAAHRGEELRPASRRDDQVARPPRAHLRAHCFLRPLRALRVRVGATQEARSLSRSNTHSSHVDICHHPT